MAHVKIIDPMGWNFERPIAQMIKVSSRGLVGSDRSDFIKLAGATAPAIMQLLDSIKIAKDEIPVHQLAIGASEYYSANRNGDGFDEATCKAQHPTFKKFAKHFRNHKNKLENNDPFYGAVKESFYNPTMHRIELLTLLNASKEAAERNGGFVADKEIQKLEKDGDYPVSMACRVAFDVCSGCQNKAKTRDEYCTSSTCKYGGCRDNLSKVAEDGHILHVQNPNAVFFDISHVYRPADRIAYGARADYLQKAASHAFTPGAELAEQLGVTAPLRVLFYQPESSHWIDESLNAQLKLASALALYEQSFQLSMHNLPGMHTAIQTPLTSAQLATLGTPGSEKAAMALGALADCKVILPLRDFANWLGKSASCDAAATCLPDIYTRLVEAGDLAGRLLHHPFAVSTKTASVAQQKLAAELQSDYSVDFNYVFDRSLRHGFRGLPAPVLQNEKRAAHDPHALELASQYAMYKLAALHRIAAFDDHFKLTIGLVIGQNKIV